MSDFSDRPFVAGSLVGLRAFTVDGYGRLVGPSQGGVFKPSENAAECRGGSKSVSIPAGATLNAEHYQMAFSSGRAQVTYTLQLPDGETRTYSSWDAIAQDHPAPDHVPGSEDCTCGFYAYFNGENTFARPDRVSALIEGYGICTVGQKGFRAGKARLVALIDPAPPPSDPDPVDPGRTSHWWTKVKPFWYPALIAAQLPFIVRNAIRHDWTSLSIGVSAVLILALFWLLVDRVDLQQVDSRRMAMALASFEASTRPVDLALVRRNYPDVPVYANLDEALAEHPLTPPPPPTPDDEDFWTRPVSA